MVPGLLGLIANLLQFGSRSGAEPPLAWWQTRHRSSSTAQELLSQPPVLGSWPLSFQVPVDRSAGSALQRSWQAQYAAGFLQELRSCPLPPALSGLCFAEVAAALYERLLVVLLALGRPDPRTGKARMILNPGYGQQLTVEKGDLLCLMVQSAEHARAVSQVAWHPETVRQRWQRHRTALPAQFTCHGSPVSPAIPLHSAVASYYINAASSTRQPAHGRATKANPATPSLSSPPPVTGNPAAPHEFSSRGGAVSSSWKPRDEERASRPLSVRVDRSARPQAAARLSTSRAPALPIRSLATSSCAALLTAASSASFAASARPTAGPSS